MFFKQVFCILNVSAVLVCSAGAATPSEKPHYFPTRDARQAVTAATAAAVVNAASFLPGVSPGGLATVFGTNLSDVTGIVSAGTNPFPTVLANVSVAVNGVLAPIFVVAFANGQDQISFQVPFETITGRRAADIQVYDFGRQVAEVFVDSYTEDPGIFAYQKYGQLYAVALHGSDYKLITPDDPAFRGEIIILYATGLGPVDRFIPNGLGAPSNPLANTRSPFRVTVAGEDARLQFSGLAPGFVGLYQVNLRLPDDLPAGDLRMRILSEFADSQFVVLPVK